MSKLIFLDNGATSFPKPEEVYTYMDHFYRNFGVNPGRSGYDLCMEAGLVVEETRKLLTQFFNGTDPNRLCFGYNSTDALNLIISGMLRPGDHADLDDGRAQLRPPAPLPPAAATASRSTSCPSTGPASSTRRRSAGGSAPTPAWSSSTTPRTSSARSSPSPRSAGSAARRASPSPSTPPNRRAKCLSTWKPSSSTSWPSPATSPSSAPRASAASMSGRASRSGTPGPAARACARPSRPTSTSIPTAWNTALPTSWASPASRPG